MNTYTINLSELEHHETLKSLTTVSEFVAGVKEVFAYSMLNSQFNARMQFQTSELQPKTLVMRIANDVNDLVAGIDIELKRFAKLPFTIILSDIPFHNNLLTTLTTDQFASSVRGLFAYALNNPEFKARMTQKAAEALPQRPQTMVIVNNKTEAPMHIPIDLAKFAQLPSLKGRFLGQAAVTKPKAVAKSESKSAATSKPVATPAAKSDSKNRSLANITEYTKRADRKSVV